MTEASFPKQEVNKNIFKGLLKGQALMRKLFLPHAEDPAIARWFHSRDLRLPPVITEEYLIGAPSILVSILRHHARSHLLKGMRVENPAQVMEEMSQRLATGFSVGELLSNANDGNSTTDIVLPLRGKDGRIIASLVYNPAWGLGWRSTELMLAAGDLNLASVQNEGSSDPSVKNIGGIAHIDPKTLAVKTEEILRLKSRKKRSRSRFLLIDVEHLPHEILTFLQELLKQRLIISHCRLNYNHKEAKRSYESVLVLTEDEAVGLHISLDQTSGLKLAGIVSDPQTATRTALSLVRKSSELSMLLHEFYPPYGY